MMMDVENDCIPGQNVISDVKQYLDCAKIEFEHRLNNEKMVLSTFDDFKLHKTIGLGSFGRVILVNHKSDSNTFLAMKVS